MIATVRQRAAQSDGILERLGGALARVREHGLRCVPGGCDGAVAPHLQRLSHQQLVEQIRRIQSAWTKTCRAAVINGLHFHDLGREFASRLRETPGISDHHVRDWLGHADLATTSRYLATTRVGLQQARAAFGRFRDGFAHDLHKPTVDTPPPTPISEAENARKSLN